MSDEAKAVQETAKAVQEIAKATPAVIEAGSNLAHWVGRVLGTAPEDVVGLVGGDYRRQLRIRNLDRIARRTNEFLAARGIQGTKEISPNRALEAFEAASQESDPDLQELWATLFANAMDPNRDVALQRVFVETLQQFEPIDALVLWRFAPYDADKITVFSAREIAASISVRVSLVEMSFGRLMDVGCLTVSPGFDAHLQALGAELLIACERDDESGP